MHVANEEQGLMGDYWGRQEEEDFSEEEGYET